MLFVNLYLQTAPLDQLRFHGNAVPMAPRPTFQLLPSVSETAVDLLLVFRWLNEALMEGFFQHFARVFGYAATCSAWSYIPVVFVLSGV